VQEPNVLGEPDGDPVIKRLIVAALVVLSAMTVVPRASAKWAANASGSVAPKSTTIQPPTNLAGTCSLATGKVTLTWTASPTPWLDGYSVEWGTASHTYTTTATTASTTFTTPALGLGTFYFGVRTTKGNWRSVYSNEISKTFLAVQCF